MSIVVNACHALAAACRTHKKRVSSLSPISLCRRANGGRPSARQTPWQRTSSGAAGSVPVTEGALWAHLVAAVPPVGFSPQAPGVYRVVATEQGGYVFEDAAGDAGERL